MHNKHSGLDRLDHNSAHSLLGFTLLEILIALFIFTIVSMLLMSALKSVISTEVGTEKKAAQLRQLQMAMLLLSRDIEQTVNRPILNAEGHKEVAFLGFPRDFTFTHGGFANPTGALLQSELQRSSFSWHDNALWRIRWPVLDQAPSSAPHERSILTQVVNLRFQYLDQDRHFHDHWPVEGAVDQPLPQAISINFTIGTWGVMNQLYVIPNASNKTMS